MPRLVGGRHRYRPRPVRDALRGDGTELFSAELTMLPQSTIPVDGSEARKVLQVIEMLDDLEDVQSVCRTSTSPKRSRPRRSSGKLEQRHVVAAGGFLKQPGTLRR